LISVCVGSINTSVLPGLLQAIQLQTYRQWELVITSQGDDQVAERVNDLLRDRSNVRHCHLTEYGRSRALNKAMEVAEADVIAFTDDDCEPSPDWLERLMACFAKDQHVGIAGGDLQPPPGPGPRLSVCPAVHSVEAVYQPSQNGFAGPPGMYFGGATLAIRRSVVGNLGWFDQYLGVGTDFPVGEDVDLVYRCEAQDIRMWSHPGAVVRHTHGRRVGLKAVSRHLRAYARGEGALIGKLELWGHPLAESLKLDASEFAKIRTHNLRRPLKALRAVYEARFVRQGRRDYLNRFELDDNLLSRPRIASAAQAN
jgi:GT2 family glycosyltransferase